MLMMFLLIVDHKFVLSQSKSIIFYLLKSDLVPKLTARIATDSICCVYSTVACYWSLCISCFTALNDLPIGWQNLNTLSHPNATLAPQARQARASGKNLNYVTLAPKVSFELLAESLF